MEGLKHILRMRSRASHHLPNKNINLHEAKGVLRHYPLKNEMPTVVVQRNVLAVMCLVLVGWIVVFSSHSPSIARSSTCQISLGTYRGPQYNSPESGTIGQPTCIVESKWLKLSQHSVRFPESTTTFDDWMWIDYHDRINVLVEDKRSPTGERRFLVFQQSKYALEGRSSKAIIGGIIEPGEEPEAAARREVYEEMNGLECTRFHALGRYRTDVNRGMGWVNSFLATDCNHDEKSMKHRDDKDEVGVMDTERQDLQSISLSQLLEFARNGEFLEVQWTATVALALLNQELISEFQSQNG